MEQRSENGRAERERARANRFPSVDRQGLRDVKTLLGRIERRESVGWLEIQAARLTVSGLLDDFDDLQEYAKLGWDQTKFMQRLMSERESVL